MIPFPVVRLQRTIPAPPEEVYEAWLDPQLLQQWMAPGRFDVQRAEVDARVGGHLRIWHADTGSHVGGFECEILELQPYERLVFRWGFVGPRRAAGPVYDSLLTITLQATRSDETTLTLVHERLDDLAAAMPEGARNVEQGWAMVLDKLAELLDRTRRRTRASAEH